MKIKKTTDPLTQSQGPVASKDDMDWDAKHHFNTLMEAEQIKQDPEKMKKVHKLAGRHKKALKSIQDLKDTYQAKFGKPAGQGPDTDEDGV